MKIETKPANYSPEEFGIKFGPWQLMPDIEKRHLFTLFFGAFFGIATMAFVNVFGPYIFDNILNIPKEEQGRLAGNLTAVQEIVVLSVIGFCGALSDRVGRRLVYSIGFCILGIGYFLYPLASTSTELIIFRTVVAFGCACNTVMLPTVANDYTHEVTRGKMIAATSIFNGLGLVLLISTFRNLPSEFSEMGYDPVWSGIYTAWVVAGLVVFVATVLFFNLKKGAPAQASTKEPYFATMKIAFKAAKDPRIALAYTAGVVSRGDLSVVSTFFTLWLYQEGISQGMTGPEAMKTAGGFYVMVQAFALPGAFLISTFIDKIDRVVNLAISMAVAACGYLYLGFIDNPLSSQMYFGAALLGLGEIFANLSAISLIGSSAPAKGRGAVIGGFSFFGALGIFIVAFIGGNLFDSIGPTAPFTMVGFANIGLLMLALFVLFIEKKKKDSQT
jgi:MFS family permease